MPESPIATLLHQAGWNPHDPAEVQPVPAPAALAEARTPYTTRTADDSDVPDYLLLDEQGRALALLAALPLLGSRGYIRQRARRTAAQAGAPLVFLAQGTQLYLWDYAHDDARRVPGLFSRADLTRRTQRAVLPAAATPVLPTPLQPYQQAVLAALAAARAVPRPLLVSLPPGLDYAALAGQIAHTLQAQHPAVRVLLVVADDTQAVPTQGASWQPGTPPPAEPVGVCALATLLHTPALPAASGAFDVVVAVDCLAPVADTWPAALSPYAAQQIALVGDAPEHLTPATYRFYQCTPGRPHLAYAPADALQAGELLPVSYASAAALPADVPPFAADTPVAPATLARLAAHIDDLARAHATVLAPGLPTPPGKLLICAANNQDATHIAAALNDSHAQPTPYALALTADTPDVAPLLAAFAEPTGPPVLVSARVPPVLTLDCPDLLTLALLRPVRSPRLYARLAALVQRPAPSLQKRAGLVCDLLRGAALAAPPTAYHLHALEQADMPSSAPAAAAQARLAAWVAAGRFAPPQAHYLRFLGHCGLARGSLAAADLHAPPCATLDMAGLGTELFGWHGLHMLRAELAALLGI